MEDQGKGADLVKTALGILLLVAGNFFAIKCFPGIPEITLLKDGTPRMVPDAAAMAMSIQHGFKLLVISLLLLNAGGLMLFWGGSKKS